MSGRTGSFAKGTLAVASLLTVLTSSQGLLTSASKTGGTYAYNPGTVPLLAEAIKFFLSWYLMEQQKVNDPASARFTTDWKTMILFLVPSVIYMLHNNVQVCRWVREGC
jgi:UDP-sugar transporter A1/2/3